MVRAYFSRLLITIARLGYSAPQRARLYRKLATLMQNGKQLQASVENLQKRAARRSKTDIEAIVLDEVLQDLRQGNSFSLAVRHFASVSERMILEAGEGSGDLPHSLQLAADILQTSSQMKTKVIAAVVSPVFLLGMLLGVLLLLSKIVMPKLTMVLEPAKWNSVAQSLYKLTEIVNSPGFFLVLLLMLAGLTAVGLSLPLWTGRGRAFCDRLPPWSMFRLLVGSGWIMSMASLVRSGETILNALQNMRRVCRGNRWLSDRLGRTIFYYNSGLNLGEALEATNTGFPDWEIVDDLVSYADMEGFDEILHSLGKQWVDTGLEKIQKQAAVFNAAAMAIVGLILGWFAYAVVSIQMSLGVHFTGMG